MFVVYCILIFIECFVTVSSIKSESQSQDRLKSPSPSIKEEDRLPSLVDSQSDVEFSIDMDAKTVMEVCK